MTGAGAEEETAVEAMTLPAAVAHPRIRRELARKSFHVASASLPLLVWLAPRWLALAVLLPTAAVAVAVDWTR
ncbi:MAG TPA: hypothetical protein VGO40_24060, partial [Longimicrobium sp.]|nr:hypothetical protein [Longimicrobium sp.]